MKRSPSGIACLLLLLVGLVSLPVPAGSAGIEEMRRLFLQAEKALLNGQRQVFLELLPQLEGYPLKPYLVQQDLDGRMDLHISDEIRSFLQGHAGTPPAENLRGKWLRLLARHERWDDFLRDHRPQANVELQCLHGKALLAAGRSPEAMALAAGIWLAPTSRPSVCDPLFDAWITSNGLSRPTVWQRIELAMTAGQTGLARYLERFLSPADRQWLDYWLRVDEDPELVLSQDWSRVQHDRMDAVLAHGMRKLTRVDATRAAADWDRLRLRHGLDRERFAAIENDVALFMSLRFEEGALERIDSLPRHLPGDRLREWGVRAALRRQDWSAVLHMLDNLTPEQQEQNRWRYWRARALQETGWDDQALALYRTLAREQNYHGMLALDRLGQELEFIHLPLTAPEAAVRRVAQVPGMRRAAELFVLNRPGPARTEWQQAQSGLDRDLTTAAAVWAREMGWHDRAIVAAASVGHTTDLELRYPLPHKELILPVALGKDLDPALVFGLMRQESLFMSDVGSSAGALGLMQIMPQTGKRIAGWHGEKLASPSLLLQPERNIRYGTSYLRKQLDDLQGHVALAMAAYNAGQHRVKGWLPPSPMPADIWVETIPFNETRNYVEKVLANVAIYEIRLGRPPARLGARLPPVHPLAGPEEAGALLTGFAERP